MNQGDIEKLTNSRHQLAAAATSFDQAHQTMCMALSDMQQVARCIDFFVEDPELSKFLRDIPKTRRAFNTVSNFAPTLHANRIVETTDEAIRQAWD